ncbi:MAG: ERCC4 domain-containing protein [bacterium]
MPDRAQRIRVVIDDRESRSGLLHILRSLKEVDVSVRRLSLGDYEVDGKFLFERKTMSDFVVSIRDGRLFQQAARLAASDKRCALILEGRGRDLAESGMRREAIQGALMSVSLFFGIPVFRSLEPEESARLFCYAARQGRRFATGALPRRGRRPQGKRRRQLAILQELPGIGPSRAAQLLEVFGNVEGVMTAGLEDLSSASGIGKKTAESIRWVMKEPGVEYPSQEDDLLF